MNSITFNHSPLLLIVVVIFFSLSGCADKQWKDPLNEKQDEATRALLLQKLEKQKLCTCCLDAEITATWESQLSSGGLNGYLQILLPDSIKLVTINPLGQPLYALTATGKKFQAINATKGVFKHGKISRFIERHNLPENLLHSEWANWIMGKIEYSDEQLEEILGDHENRGIWLNINKGKKSRFPREFLLYDTLNNRLLERVAMDKNGDEALRILYSQWESVNGCKIPSDIHVEGVSFGTDVQIKLKDILNDKEFSLSTFRLKLPPGYLQQFYP